LEYSILAYIVYQMSFNKTIYTDQYRNLIERLRKARINANLTQSQVAQSLGLTQSFISKVEAGQYRLDIVQIQHLAKLYRKPITYFIKS
jgi:transcriptional regulator with XRE-family HTH domain